MKYFSTCFVLLLVAIIQENIPQVASFQTSHHSQYQCGQHSKISSSAFVLPKCLDGRRSTSGPLRMSESDNSKDDFWQQQRDLMKDLTDQNEVSLKAENKKNFAKVQSGLIVETVFISSLIFSLLWLACDNPFVPISYVFGSAFGTAYAYGLGKFVEVVGGTIDDANAVEGAGVGQARFAFLILLFIFIGKLRAYGLMELPSIAGFFTYQLASLSQGLKEEKIE